MGNTSALGLDKYLLGQKNGNYKRKMGKFDFIKINFYHVEDTVKKMKMQTTGKGNIFAKHTSEKGLWI